MTLWSTLVLAAQRLRQQRLLTLCLLAGLIAAVALLSSIPLYAEAVHNRLLQGQLTEQGTTLPPFAFVWRYIGAWHGDVDEAVYSPADEYLGRQAPGVVGLPLQSRVRHVQTTQLRLFPAPDSQSFVSQEPLLWAGLGFVTGLEQHVQLLEGTFPNTGLRPDSGSEVPVLVSQALANQLGLQLGERYLLFGQTDGAQIPLRISGVWRPLDPADPFWFYRPGAFDDVLLTGEAAFNQSVVPALETPVSQAVWYQIYDGSRVRTGDVAALLSRVRVVEARVTALLEGTTLDISPVPALQTYGRAARRLTVLLTIFAVPVVGLVLYFIGLVAGMVVRRGQNEIAVLRSRGATREQILLIYLLQGLLVGLLGLAGGLLLARGLAALMGRARSFLTLESTADPLPIVLSPAAWQYGLLGVALAILALLLPALLASRHTIVSYKWQRARALLRPLWQRTFLDVLLLVPPLYGWYLLDQQGTIALPGSGDDPFSNPLLFLVPALFCFSLALLAVRFFPLIMGALAWLAGRLPAVTPLLTLRQLARAAGQYGGPLLLLSLTLSLAIFTASMALTLDEHLVDSVYYDTGADLRLAELGQSTEEPDQPASPGGPAASDGAQGPRFLFLPVGEHLQVDGVQAAARVGDYSATSSIGGRQRSGRLLGLDRLDFQRLAFFRPDFAGGESLGSLMNRLGAARDHVLVSRPFLAANNLAVGDPLPLTVGAAGDFANLSFTIAGAFDLFPTYYPQDGPLFVANLDYVHEGLGGTYPYDVWLATGAVPSGEQIVSGVRGLGITVVTAQDARQEIREAQTRPERQGLFGLLSVGFLAAAALTVLGFLVYAVISFRQRFVELGMLRAIGLSTGQMAAYLAGEQAALIAAGMGLGTAIGVAAARLFIPFLQVGDGQVPPFVVHVAWDQIATIYALFGAMFLAAVAALTLLLRRMRVFEAVKLGEAV